MQNTFIRAGRFKDVRQLEIQANNLLKQNPTWEVVSLSWLPIENFIDVVIVLKQIASGGHKTEMLQGDFGKILADKFNCSL